MKALEEYSNFARALHLKTAKATDFPKGDPKDEDWEERAKSYLFKAKRSIELKSLLQEANVIEQLRGNPHVAAVHHTTGRWDLIAEIQADGLSSFNKIVGALRLIKGVTSTETNLLLDSYD